MNSPLLIRPFFSIALILVLVLPDLSLCLVTVNLLYPPRLIHSQISLIYSLFFMIFLVKNHPSHQPHPSLGDSKPLNIPFWFKLPLCGTCLFLPSVLFLNSTFPLVHFSFFIFISRYGLLFGPVLCRCWSVFPSYSLCIFILLLQSLLQPFSFVPFGRTETTYPFPLISSYVPLICFWLLGHHPTSPNTSLSEYLPVPYDDLIWFPDFSCVVLQFYVVLQNYPFVSFISKNLHICLFCELIFFFVWFPLSMIYFSLLPISTSITAAAINKGDSSSYPRSTTTA